MKTLDELKNQSPIFLNDWKESGMFGFVADFEGLYLSEKEYNTKPDRWDLNSWQKSILEFDRAKQKYEEYKVILASYSYQDYSGDAYALLLKDDKFFEVDGSHCSCYGLEGQFEPKEVNLKELENRLTKGSFGKDSYCGNEFNKELKHVLGISVI